MGHRAPNRYPPGSFGRVDHYDPGPGHSLSPKQVETLRKAYNARKGISFDESYPRETTAAQRQRRYVDALLEAPEVDWEVYEREVGVLLHMMPEPVEVVQTPAFPQRGPNSHVLRDGFMVVVGACVVLWTAFFDMEPYLLVVGAALMMSPSVMIH